MSLYDPAVHAEHTPPFAPVNPWLQRHMLETLLPLGESEFAGQAKQELDTIAPVVVRYVPALQFTQELATVAPVVVRNLPAPQFTQELPTIAPVVVRNLPAPQSVHETEPVTSLYFPAAHAEHVPPSGPVNPWLQRQTVERVLPIGDCEFPGQLKQNSEAEALTFIEYLPAPQPMHVAATDAPTVVEYMPAPQSLHVAAT